MTRLLALDLGTTSFKAVVYDEHGRKLGEQRADPPDRRIEIDGVPVDIWETDALWAVVSDLLNARRSRSAVPIDALAIAQLGLIGVPLDAGDQPLFPFVTWLDPSAGTAGSAGAQRPHRRRSVRGRRQPPELDLPAGVDRMDVRARRRALPTGMKHWVFVGDWLAYRLCGELRSDYSITSQTLALDQTHARPARGPAACVRARRGPVRGARAGRARTIGGVTADAARATGLRAGVPVVLGGADWLVGVFGSGLTEPGDVGILTGTWELTFTCAAAAVPDRGRLRERRDLRSACGARALGAADRGAVRSR